jgi:hypothetical protein
MHVTSSIDLQSERLMLIVRIGALILFFRNHKIYTAALQSSTLRSLYHHASRSKAFNGQQAQRERQAG